MEALESWHDFYVLVGTAGATLLALLFVAVSLGTGFLSESRADATRAFFSPVVIHFSVLFPFRSCLVPGPRFFYGRYRGCARLALRYLCSRQFR